MPKDIEIDASALKAAESKIKANAPGSIQTKAGEILKTDVIDATVSKIPVGPLEGGHVRDAYTTGLIAGEAYVRWDRDRFPYAGWLQHGGTRGRQYEKSGRWFYPELGKARVKINKEADRVVSRIIELNGYS